MSQTDLCRLTCHIRMQLRRPYQWKRNPEIKPYSSEFLQNSGLVASSFRFEQIASVPTRASGVRPESAHPPTRIEWDGVENPRFDCGKGQREVQLSSSTAMGHCERCSICFASDQVGTKTIPFEKGSSCSRISSAIRHSCSRLQSLPGPSSE